jgi:ferredoxin-NADP reductase
VAARSPLELYDRDAIDKMAVAYPWLTVTYVTDTDSARPGQPADLVERALAAGDWRSRHVYVCGSDAMVASAVAALTRAGYQEAQLHYEAFGEHWYGSNWRMPDQAVTGGAR